MGTALVTPWILALCTAGATLPGKLLTTGLLAPSYRLWIKAGGGTVAAQKTFAGGVINQELCHSVDRQWLAGRQAMAGQCSQDIFAWCCRPSMGPGAETALNL